MSTGKPFPMPGAVQITRWTQLKLGATAFYWTGTRNGWEPCTVYQVGPDHATLATGVTTRVNVTDLSLINIPGK